MSERAEHTLRKITDVSLFLAAGACLVFWLVRVYYAISFVTPYLLTTTGYEWENMFSLWKLTQHQAVYTDPNRIPFTVSYYNWAYYYLYGWITNGWLHLLHLDAIWIPTIARLITLLFTLLTGRIFWLARRDFVKAGFFRKPAVAWAWILIAIVGPLVGFWSITVRPDMGALAFEAAGLYVILRYLRKPDARLIIVAALLFYVAWAFKQSSVTMLAGSVLALLVLKRWQAFLTLSGIWWVLVLATLIVGGPVYRENVLFSQQHLPMTVPLGLKNALRAVGKNPFFLLCLAAIIGSLFRKFRLVRSRPGETAITLVALLSFCFAFVTSCKYGANDNYFIPAAWAAMLGFALQWEEMNPRWMLAGLAACSWLLVGAIALSPTQRTFYYDYQYQDALHRIMAQKLSHLPGPAFVIEPYANLPWVQRFSPHFVIPDTYYFDRKAGVPAEDGGWEGMARQGYFGTLVLDERHGPTASLLQKYKLVDEYKDGHTDLKFYRPVGSQSP